MTAISDCPAESTLQKLLSDRLAADISRRLAEHVGQCDSCQQKLVEYEAAPNVANQVAGLKNKTHDSDHLSDVMNDLKSLRSNSPPDPPATAEISIDTTSFTHDGYELLGMLGKGGMGVVYKAHEKALDRIVAIKVLSPTLASDPASRQRFVREARSAAAVVHPNVITIHAISDKLPLPYLVMEYVEGISLQQQLDAGSPISIENIVRIGRQIAAGLSAAHSKSVVHRDIKPGNILLNATTGKVLLGDFGLARAINQSRLTQTGTLLGTPAYVAPEVVEQPNAADQRADLFSLGVVMYAMCTGDSPFQADTLFGTLHRLASLSPKPLAQTATEVPQWLSQIVARLLEKNPDDRFQSAAELREALGRGVSQPVVTANTPTSTTLAPQPVSQRETIPKLNTGKRTKRRSRSNPTWLYGGALAAIGLIVALGAVMLSSNGARDTASAEQSQGRVKPDSTKAKQNPPNTPSIERQSAEPQLPTIQWTTNDTGVFVCKDDDGEIVDRYDTLQDAIDSQSADGTIEIQTDGPLKISQCFIENSRTIIAGDGFTPTLVFEPNHEIDLEAMLSTEGTLTLQGIELRLPERFGEEEEYSLIGVQSPGQIELIDCRLVVEAGGFCVSSHSQVAIENCHFHAPQSTVLDLDPHQDTQITLKNSWLSGQTVFESGRDFAQVIDMNQCTVVCSELVRTYEEVESESELQLLSQQSLFVCKDTMILLEDEEEGSDQNIQWKGQRNIYSGALDGVFENQASVAAEKSRYDERPFEEDFDKLVELVLDRDFQPTSLQRRDGINAGADDR